MAAHTYLRFFSLLPCRPGRARPGAPASPALPPRKRSARKCGAADGGDDTENTITMRAGTRSPGPTAPRKPPSTTAAATMSAAQRALPALRTMPMRERAVGMQAGMQAGMVSWSVHIVKFVL